MSQSHRSSFAFDRLSDSSQDSNNSGSGSASSDFSATSATDFNLGQLKAQMTQMLSFLRPIDTERRKCRRILLGLVAKQQEFEALSFFSRRCSPTIITYRALNHHFQLPLMAVGSHSKYATTCAPGATAATPAKIA